MEENIVICEKRDLITLLSKVIWKWMTQLYNLQENINVD